MSRYDMRVMRVMVETLNEAYPRMDREIKQRDSGGWYGSTASQDCMVSPTKSSHNTSDREFDCCQQIVRICGMLHLAMSAF